MTLVAQIDSNDGIIRLSQISVFKIQDKIQHDIIDSQYIFPFFRHTFGTVIFTLKLNQIYQVKGSHGLEKKT